VQACLWSEKLDDRRLFDRIAFPRLSAIAESAWTPSLGKDFGRFQAIDALMPGVNGRGTAGPAGTAKIRAQ
jgi:hexosaminidase